MRNISIQNPFTKTALFPYHYHYKYTAFQLCQWWFHVWYNVKFALYKNINLYIKIIYKIINVTVKKSFSNGKRSKKLFYMGVTSSQPTCFCFLAVSFQNTLGSLYMPPGPKISTHSMRMDSTIWFWYTILTSMFPDSNSGHMRVGPNTMLMPWVDIKFFFDFVKSL